MISDKIYLKRYIQMNDYYFVRIKGKFFKTEGKSINRNDLHLFIGNVTRGKLKLFYIAEASSGLRITKYNKSLSKVIKKMKEVLSMRSIGNIEQHIFNQNKNKLSPRYQRIVKLCGNQKK